MSKDLTENAVVVRFSCGQWSGTARDDDMAEEIREEKNAKKPPRVTVPLAIDNELDALSKVVTECRTWHYKHTFPFEFGASTPADPKKTAKKENKGKKLAGLALVPIDMFEEYCRTMQGYRLKIEGMAQSVVDNYDELIDKAERAQNGMFKREKYPTKEELERRYHFDLVFEPVPADHFLTKITCDALKQAEKEHQARLEEAKAAAFKESFARLHKVVNHAFESLANPKKVFRDSLVENIVELVGILPKMNITGDVMLDELVKEAQSNLTQFLPKELREDPVIRKDAADKAKAILDKMAGYIGTPEPVIPEPPKPEPEPEQVTINQPFTRKTRGDYALEMMGLS